MITDTIFIRLKPENNICVCVCVCVCERERERERGSDFNRTPDLQSFTKAEIMRKKNETSLTAFWSFKPWTNKVMNFFKKRWKF
jgi:hypothetical protein